MENNGFVYNKETEFFSVNFENVDKGISSLTKEILEIQGNGDCERAQKLIDKYAKNEDCTKKALQKLQEKKIPVDIEPCFEWTGLKQ